jgi:hypothetical protein
MTFPQNLPLAKRIRTDLYRKTKSAEELPEPGKVIAYRMMEIVYGLIPARGEFWGSETEVCRL